MDKKKKELKEICQKIREPMLKPNSIEERANEFLRRKCYIDKKNRDGSLSPILIRDNEEEIYRDILSGRKNHAGTILERAIPIYYKNNMAEWAGEKKGYDIHLKDKDVLVECKIGTETIKKTTRILQRRS